jgi:TonB family protein
MSEALRQWEGRIVAGKFPVESYLGESDHSAVFTTQGQGGRGKAVIKMIAADAASAEQQLRRCRAARELSHPNLIRIIEAGQEGTALLYVVEEYAEENLAQILPERALTAEEAREMLRPVCRALQYLHGKGFVHGHIQPSNILAIGDQVKLSSDSLGTPGEKRHGAASAYRPPEATNSTAGDVWQLGMTIVEALTQHLPVWDRTQTNAPQIPATVPEPFREIAAHCLQIEAGKRWTVAQVFERMGEARSMPRTTLSRGAIATSAIVGQRKTSAKWPYALAVAALVVVVLFVRYRSSGPATDAQSTQAQQENVQPVQASTPPELGSGGSVRSSANAGAARAGEENGVVRQMMPKVSPAAQRTIQGTIKVRIKVSVDAAGNVTEASQENEVSSRYFPRVALEAAKEWKFIPAQDGEREWKLLFVFTREKIEVTPTGGRAKR